METKERNYAQEVVLQFLKLRGLRQSVRGSWKYGDFHLNQKGTSLSDLDLVIEDLSSEDRVALRTSLIAELPIRMNVSIHPKDSLLEMSLEESRILNVCEFVSKLGTCSLRELSYARAKILLLLARQSISERYGDVAARLGTPQSQQALRVKLGQSSRFTIPDSVAIACSSGQVKAVELIEQCVVQQPTSSYLASLIKDLRSCTTIDSWLKQHLLGKLGIKEWLPFL